MPSKQEHTQQRHISSAHSRHPTSLSSIGASDSPHANDQQHDQQHDQQQEQQQQEQQEQQQEQYEAPASIPRRPSQWRVPSSGSITSNTASQQSKLDGVIYHFYTTTANLVIQSRLAHLRAFLLAAPSDASPAEQRPASAAGTSSQSKLSRWFGLHIPDSDLFKDELRLWRSVTLMLQDASNANLPRPHTAKPPSSVPDLIVDVMLDLSSISDHHEILLLTSPSTASRSADVSGRRYCIDGRRPGETVSSRSPPRSHRIVLERWRLRFDPSTPSDPPDLSTFYKRSVVHFRALFSLLCSLPANRLAAKIEGLKSAPEKRSSVSHPSFSSLAARDDMGSHDTEMNIGCRLSMASDQDHAEPALPKEIGVTDPLPLEQLLDATSAEETQIQHNGRTSSHGHYAVRTLAPIATPVGHLELSVTYRKLTGFSIEDAQSLRSAKEIKVDLDEDYFRKPQISDPAPRQHTIRTEAPSDPSQHGASIHSRTVASQEHDRPPSLSRFPAPVQQRIGGISAARPASLAAQRNPPDSASATVAVPHPAGADASMSQSPANTSVFSTSAPGRHSAGLSSLRRTGSNKSNLSLMSSANPSGAPSSPALAAALSVEPAFVVPSSVRRPSTSERRVRTLSGLSSGRPSPPVSPASATFELPEAGTSVPRGTSAAFSISTTGRSISTRTTSGFAGTTTGNMGPPSSQPRPSVSFSPSSPSPLVQQLTLQGSRLSGGSGLAPTSSHTTSSYRSVSGSGLRSSLSGTGVLTTPSLRSVFQNYVPRSQNVSSASMSRTPPTSTSAFVHGSYSPSNLGSGIRSSSIRRNSSTSDAGSGSAFSASMTSSSAATASAAKPQMIKRYSTNFSYRQNRERTGIYGSSLGSEASSSMGGGGEPSSYSRFGGAGGSLSSAYGRSWVTRMEQRQGLGTGGAFARTSSLDYAAAAVTASATSRYRPTSAPGGTQIGGLTPSPRSHDEDMDDLVRLLGARPAFGTSSMGKLTSLRNERRNAPGLSSTPEEGANSRPGHGSDALTDSVQSNLGQDRPSSLSCSGLRSGGGIRTTNPMSRSQLDELLSRMAESVGILGSKEQGSSTSGETISDVAASNESRAHKTASAPSVRSAASQIPSTSQPLTSIQAAATVGKGQGSAGIEPSAASETLSSRLSSPGTLTRARPGEVGARSRSAVGHQVRAYGTSSVRTASIAATGDAMSRLPRDDGSPAAPAVPPSLLTVSLEPNRIPDYEAEGDLIFKVDGQQEYDPEDELPGEMEMMPEEGADSAARSTANGATTFGGGVEGGMGATLPVGAHREGRAHDWHVAERWERERAQEAERRRADAEMSRNFGEEVGASTRGRGSHSPWRTTTHSSPQAATTLGPGTPQSTSGAVAIGFRSSSTRPLTGTNRLVGVGVGSTGLSLATADARRGYGVSAPSTQLHYQPTPRPPAAQSHPVSRDELYNDDDDADEDADEDAED